MKSKAILSPLPLLCAFGLPCFFVGCDQDHADSSAVSVTNVRNTAHTDHHAHPELGPHGGELIELGQEAYHAELVHGASSVSIFVLDGSATRSVPIRSKSLAISMKYRGQVKRFDVAAAPDRNDPNGRCSRFVSSNPQLEQWIEAGAEGAIMIQVNGKSYTGKIAHDHDHGHDHDHDHDGHTH